MRADRFGGGDRGLHGTTHATASVPGSVRQCNARSRRRPNVAGGVRELQEQPHAHSEHVRDCRVHGPIVADRC